MKASSSPATSCCVLPLPTITEMYSGRTSSSWYPKLTSLSRTRSTRGVLALVAASMTGVGESPTTLGLTRASPRLVQLGALGTRKVNSFLERPASMIEPVRVGAQHEPAPAIVLIYKEGSKVRKRVMPLRGLIQLEPDAVTRKMIEAHRTFLEAISSAQLTDIITRLIADTPATPTAPPPAPPPTAKETATSLLPSVPSIASPPPSIAVETAPAPATSAPPEDTAASPVELNRALLHELAGELDSSGYSSAGGSSERKGAAAATSGADAAVTKTPTAASPVAKSAPATDGSLLRSVNFDDVESSTGSVDSLLGSIVSAGASPAGSPAKMEAKAAAPRATGSPAAMAAAPKTAPGDGTSTGTSAGALAAPAAAPSAAAPAAATLAAAAAPAAAAATTAAAPPPAPVPRQLAPVGGASKGLAPLGSAAGLSAKPLAPLSGSARTLGGGLANLGGSGSLGMAGGSGSLGMAGGMINDGVSSSAGSSIGSGSTGGGAVPNKVTAHAASEPPSAAAERASPAKPLAVPLGRTLSGSAAPTGADEAFDVSEDDFDDFDDDGLDERDGGGGRRDVGNLDDDFDEPSPARSPAKSPGWKAPTAAALLSDDDGSDSDDGEELILGKGTAKKLSGLLDGRATANHNGAGGDSARAVPFGAPFKAAGLGGRPPLGGALSGQALKPLGGAGSSLAPLGGRGPSASLGAGRWK